MDCPRCGDPLAVYELGERREAECEACGYAGIEVDLHVERRAGETWAEALRRFDAAAEGERDAEVEPAIVRVDE